MKKTFTLLTMLLSIFMFTNAQTAGKKLVFVDEDEKEITDGTVINAEALTELSNDSLFFSKTFSIANNNETNYSATVKMRVTSITGGELGLAALDKEGTMSVIGNFETENPFPIYQRNIESGVVNVSFSGLKTQSATVVVELYASTINDDGTYGEKELQQTITLVFNKQTQKNSLVFVDKQGNVIEDGATLYLDKAVDDRLGLGGKVIDTGLFIHNQGTEKMFAMIKGNVEEITGKGTFQICYPEDCKFLDAVGAFATDAKEVSPNASANTDIEAKFTFSVRNKATGIVSLQIYSAKISAGEYVEDQPQAKVKLVFNSKATGVELLSANVAERYNVFNAQGMLIVGNATKIEGLKQGVYVVQTLKNNKVVDTKKYIVK